MMMSFADLGRLTGLSFDSVDHFRRRFRIIRTRQGGGGEETVAHILERDDFRDAVCSVVVSDSEISIGNPLEAFKLNVLVRRHELFHSVIGRLDEMEEDEDQQNIGSMRFEHLLGLLLLVSATRDGAKETGTEDMLAIPRLL